MNEHGECFEFLVKPLIQAVDFAWHFMHPDGSYGGEYVPVLPTFMPHGFEIMSSYRKSQPLNKTIPLSIDHGRRYHTIAIDDCSLCVQLHTTWKTHKGSEGCILKARQKLRQNGFEKPV